MNETFSSYVCFKFEITRLSKYGKPGIHIMGLQPDGI